MMTPQGRCLYGPIGTVGRTYKEAYYTLLHIKHESAGHYSFGEGIFFMFSHCKSMEANDPQGGAIFDPRGMIRRINVKLYNNTMYHTKYRSFSSVVSEKKTFFVYSKMSSSADTSRRRGFLTLLMHP